jgi:hypothetical protein
MTNPDTAARVLIAQDELRKAAPQYTHGILSLEWRDFYASCVSNASLVAAECLRRGDALAASEGRVRALEAELDPPVCHLQFPDGSVPGNVREAAEGWKRWHDDKQALIAKLEAEVARLRGERRVSDAAIALAIAQYSGRTWHSIPDKDVESFRNAAVGLWKHIDAEVDAELARLAAPADGGETQGEK